MKKVLFLLVCLPACSAMFAATISNVVLSEREDGVIVASYSLDADAIVTADFRVGGVSLGGTNQWSLAGDVHRLVTADGETKHITWNPRRDMSGVALSGVTVELKAWAESDAPDYLVADLLSVSDCRLRYYPSVEFLPGGVLSNAMYRMYRLPFRRMHSKNVTWTMGTTNEKGRDTDGREDAHAVTFDYDYYMGVFEFTQAQTQSVGASAKGDYSGDYRWRFTPHSNSRWTDVRGTNPSGDPASSSILGLASTRAGIIVDLPTEAQWEFAARGGYGEGTWGDGSTILTSADEEDENLTRLAVYKYNGNAVNYTGICQPNAYGLYDMHGNVREFCRDWYQGSIGDLGGALCVDAQDGSLRADGVVGTNVVVRGGYYSYKPSGCRAAYRSSVDKGDFKIDCGFRAMTLANLGADSAPTVAVSSNSIDIDPSRGTASGTTASAVNLRTYNSLTTDAFDLDMLKTFGSALSIR